MVQPLRRHIRDTHEPSNQRLTESKKDALYERVELCSSIRAAETQTQSNRSRPKSPYHRIDTRRPHANPWLSQDRHSSSSHLCYVKDIANNYFPRRAVQEVRQRVTVHNTHVDQKISCWNSFSIVKPALIFNPNLSANVRSAWSSKIARAQHNITCIPSTSTKTIWHRGMQKKLPITESSAFPKYMHCSSACSKWFTPLDASCIHHLPHSL